MPLGLVRHKGDGHVKIKDNTKDANTEGRVNSDGQVNVKFHSNPKQLAEYFQRFEHAFEQRQEKRPARKHKFTDPEKPSPAPRLNIAIHIVGSRGDVQPFIPIAQLLIGKYGHRVRICTHPNFKDLVESNGVEFFSIGGDPEALMAYMVKNPGLLPSRESLKAGDIGKRKKEMAEILSGVWRSCIEAGDGTSSTPIKAANVASAKDLFIADAIIANPPSMAHIHCAEKLNVPLHMVFTMPWSPTTRFHHPLAAMQYGEAEESVGNYLSFMMMELLTWEGLGDVINEFRVKTLRLDPVSPLWGYQLLPRMRVPYTYLWSQTLILKPSDWDDHIKITGFSFLPLASSYVPPPDLAEFLAKGPPPVYIGFGSIVVDDPNALTALIKEAVKLAGVRAIVSKGWGGVGGGDTPENMYLIGNCPHDWLFQRVSAVVHHGGAGTTAAGIALGRPTVVVPFFGDQPFWGQMIARAGAGPVPVPFKKMTAETLAESIRFALKPEVQIAVQQMASKMAEEDGAGDTAEDFEERLGIDDFRCDLFPERLAVWHHKKTGAQLSGFAVSCLIQNHLIHRDHVKMLKRKHWYVDEGAEFPLVGVLAAVTGIFHMVAYATSVYRKRLRRANPIPPGDEEKSEVLQRKASIVEGPMQEWRPGQKITLKQMEVLALKMANKTSDSRTYGLGDKGHINDDLKSGAAVTQREKEHSRAYQITKATGMYAFDLTKAGLKTPVAFWYNLANGCHNLPSYGVWSNEVRRRDEITGLGSGFRTAGKEFVLGFYDAFSGIVTLPYQGAKEEGAKGFGKGCWRAFRGLTMNIGCAVFGLPGYTLKGVEKGLQRRQLTKLKAELLLIRLRQSIEEYQEIGDGEKEEAVRRWKVLYP